MDADCDTHNTPQMKQQACERRYKCDLADTSVNFSEHVTVCSSVSEAGRQTDRVYGMHWTSVRTKMQLRVHKQACVCDRCLAGMVLSFKYSPNPSPIPGVHRHTATKTQAQTHTLY